MLLPGRPAAPPAAAPANHAGTLNFLVATFKNVKETGEIHSYPMYLTQYIPDIIIPTCNQNKNDCDSSHSLYVANL